MDTGAEKDSPTAEEGEKFSESSEFTIPDEGNETIEVEDVEVSITDEKSEGSITTPKRQKQLVTIEASKVFTLRLHDMRWI